MTLSFPLSPDHTRPFAAEWIAAWNAHDLDAILGHYASGVVLTSPVAARLTGEATVTGIEALGSYFARGLSAFPDLHFGLLGVFTGFSSVVLVYTNQNGNKTAEFMEFDSSGKVVRVVANYAA